MTNITVTREDKRELALERFPYNFWLTWAMKKVFRKVLDQAYQLWIEEGKKQAEKLSEEIKEKAWKYDGCSK